MSNRQALFSIALTVRIARLPRLSGMAKRLATHGRTPRNPEPEPTSIYGWIDAPPSRRLRKLYKELDRITQALEAARQRDYHSEHAPTDLTMRREAMRPLERERDLVIERIMLLQHPSD
jgi:hypothetical protein